MSKPKFDHLVCEVLNGHRPLLVDENIEVCQLCGMVMNFHEVYESDEEDEFDVIVRRLT